MPRWSSVTVFLFGWLLFIGWHLNGFLAACCKHITSCSTETGASCGRSSGCAPPVVPTGLPAGSALPRLSRASPPPCGSIWTTSCSCCSSPVLSFDRPAPEIKFA